MTLPKPAGKMVPRTDLHLVSLAHHPLSPLPVVTLSAEERSSSYPKTSRKRLCLAGVELQLWLQCCVPSHLHAGYARGEPRHTVSQLILLMGYLKQTLIALKSRQLSTAASG